MLQCICSRLLLANEDAARGLREDVLLFLRWCIDMHVKFLDRVDQEDGTCRRIKVSVLYQKRQRIMQKNPCHCNRSELSHMEKGQLTNCGKRHEAACCDPDKSESQTVGIEETSNTGTNNLRCYSRYCRYGCLIVCSQVANECWKRRFWKPER